MSDIDVVTPEMMAEMIKCRDKWIAIGLDTTPANHAKAEDGLNGAYEVAGKKRPYEIHWVASPHQGIILAAQWIAGDNMLPWGDPKLPQVSKDDVIKALGLSCYGQFDAGWHAFYEYLQPYLPDKISKLEPQREIAKYGHWWWPFDNGAIMCERPTCINVDGEGRLNCLTGPAIHYVDAFSLFAYHGTQVPDTAILNPRSITPEQIRQQSDSAMKKALMELAPTIVGILAEDPKEEAS